MYHLISSNGFASEPIKEHEHVVSSYNAGVWHSTVLMIIIIIINNINK
jgi:hypothetical protein